MPIYISYDPAIQSLLPSHIRESGVLWETRGASLDPNEDVKESFTLSGDKEKQS